MNSRQRVRNIVSSICAAALFCAAAGVPAQSVYRHVDAAGRITYSDQPEATLLVQAAPGSDVTNALARSSAISSRRASGIDAKEATRRLGQAQLKRKQGVQPLPGELAQGQGAGVVHHSYWRRQEKLRQDVELAQRRSNETGGVLLAQR